jgi:hypothetical protein
MEDKKVLERFLALHELVNQVHDQCKTELDVMELIDIFARHNSLAAAFQEDCQLYLKTVEDPSPQLSDVLNEIHSALSCSVGHIHQAAHELRTPIIRHFIQQMVEPRKFPN